MQVIHSVAAFSSLFLGTGILLAGSGLLGLLLGLRGASEGFSTFTVGVIMSGFYLGYVLGAWLCPILIHRVGHIRAFTAFASASAVIALAYGFIVDPAIWWALRVVSGMLLLGLYMVIESWLYERSAQTAEAHGSADTRGQVFAVYVMVHLLAVGSGQYLLLINGVGGLASFALVAIFFSLGLIPIALTPATQPALIRTERLAVRRLFAVSPVGAMGALFSGLVVGSFWSLSGLFGRDIGLDDGQIANFIMATVAGGAILQWPIGWLSDNADRRLVLTAVCMAAAVALAGVMAVSDAAPAALNVMSFVFGGFGFSMYGLSVAQTHDRFLSHEVLEATRGTLLLHGIGAAIGPVLTGLAMTWLANGFAGIIALLCIVMAAFTALRIRIDPPVPNADRTMFAPMEQTSPVGMDLDPRTPDFDDPDTSPAGAELTPDVADLPAGEPDLDAADLAAG